MEVVSGFVEKVEGSPKHGSIVSNGQLTQLEQVKNTHHFPLFAFDGLNLVQPIKIGGGWVKKRTPK